MINNFGQKLRDFGILALGILCTGLIILSKAIKKAFYILLSSVLVPATCMYDYVLKPLANSYPVRRMVKLASRIFDKMRFAIDDLSKIFSTRVSRFGNNQQLMNDYDDLLKEFKTYHITMKKLASESPLYTFAEKIYARLSDPSIDPIRRTWHAQQKIDLQHINNIDELHAVPSNRILRDWNNEQENLLQNAHINELDAMMNELRTYEALAEIGSRRDFQYRTIITNSNIDMRYRADLKEYQTNWTYPDREYGMLHLLTLNHGPKEGLLYGYKSSVFDKPYHEQGFTIAQARTVAQQRIGSLIIAVRKESDRRQRQNP